MELTNPIDQLSWFLGKWEGALVESEDKKRSVIYWRKFGDEVHTLELAEFQGKIQTLKEIYYLFFDKTYEVIKCIIFNVEGYYESYDVELLKVKENIKLILTFQNGVNLPPNMKITREFIQSSKTNELNTVVKMGAKQSLFSKGNYTKKESYS